MPKHGEKKVGVCDVHRLVDKDFSNREVYYCEDCSAWICKKCEPNYYRRAIAWAKQSAGKIMG